MKNNFNFMFTGRSVTGRPVVKGDYSVFNRNSGGAQAGAAAIRSQISF
jgi:hypothetical protein